MKHIFIVALLSAALISGVACDKSKKTEEADITVQAAPEQNMSEDKPRRRDKVAALPTVSRNRMLAAPKGSFTAKAGSRGPYQELKFSSPTDISFLAGVTEIPADQCAQMHIDEMRGFKREEIPVEASKDSKIKRKSHLFTSEKAPDKKIQAETLCLPLAGSMERCKDPNEKCLEDLQIANFFLGYFLSENESEMVQPQQKKGFGRMTYVCRPDKRGEKPKKMTAMYSNDYKGNGVAVSAVRAPDGWFVSNCRSEKAGEAALMGCLCSTLP